MFTFNFCEKFLNFSKKLIFLTNFQTLKKKKKLKKISKSLKTIKNSTKETFWTVKFDIEDAESLQILIKNDVHCIESLALIRKKSINYSQNNFTNFELLIKIERKMSSANFLCLV